MSNAHHTINIRNGLKMGDGKIKDSMIIDGLWCAMNDYHMGTTAENIAEKFGISKDEQDQFATNSQNKAENAQKNNHFTNEIVPVTIKIKKEEVNFADDEFPDMEVNEKISSLKPVFKKDGTVTAGNASGLNDGSSSFADERKKSRRTWNQTYSKDCFLGNCRCRSINHGNWSCTRSKKST